MPFKLFFNSKAKRGFWDYISISPLIYAFLGSKTYDIPKAIIAMKSYSQDHWKNALKDDKNAEIIDVRSIDEYEEGHIPEAKVIDVQDPQHFINRLEELDKTKKYFVYCNSGNRGNQACLVMDYNGFEHVYNLEGGFKEWNGEKEA